MANVKLYDKNGAEQIFEGVETITLDSTVEGETVTFGLGGGGDHYVTFKNGDTVLAERPVIDGNTCGDIVALGVIDPPTKTPTNTIAYVHTGWSLTDGGEADSNALVNVTENRTVYAAYEETVRLYTVRFFDGDTLIHTMQVEYMQDADYIPTKEGYFLESWQPSNKGITADVDCYAQWSETPNFATASWAKIREIAEAGQAKTFFKEGDTKNITLKNGEVISVCIAGFVTEVLSSPETNNWIIENGKMLQTNITFITQSLVADTAQNWQNAESRSHLPQGIMSLLPDDLIEAAAYTLCNCDKFKSNGKYDSTERRALKFFVPHADKLNKTISGVATGSPAVTKLYPFSAYTDSYQWQKKLPGGTLYVGYRTATGYQKDTIYNYYYINSSGVLKQSSSETENLNCFFCFCV